MLIFWGAVILMLGAALFMVLRPLFERSAKRSIDANDAMVEIYRNRLQEMESEVSSGVLAGKDAGAVRAELARTLLQEADTGRDKQGATRLISGRHWWSAAIIAIVVPATAVLLYLRLGTPELADGPLPVHAGITGGTAHMESIEAMVRRLADRLEQQPDDPEGWMMLVNSYVTLGRYADALSAVEHLYRLTGDEPSVLVRYADMLAMVDGGNLSGKPSELIQKALTLDPDNAIGLWLAGMAAEQAGSPAAAIEYWQRLLPLLEADHASQQEVNELIAHAREQLGAGEEIQLLAPSDGTSGVDAVNGSLTINVSLSPELVQESSPEQALFVVARADNGTPVPVAVIRRTVADLPLDITMDDSHSMTPGMKLSSFTRVELSARVSVSGGALPQAGDLVSALSTVTPGQHAPVTLVIDRKLH